MYLELELKGKRDNKCLKIVSFYSIYSFKNMINMINTTLYRLADTG